MHRTERWTVIWGVRCGVKYFDFLPQIAVPKGFTLRANTSFSPPPDERCDGYDVRLLAPSPPSDSGRPRELFQAWCRIRFCHLLPGNVWSRAEASRITSLQVKKVTIRFDIDHEFLRCGRDSYLYTLSAILLPPGDIAGGNPN